MYIFLLTIDDGTTMIIYLFAAILSWAIFYYTVKAAVKNGILETQVNSSTSKAALKSIPDKPANIEQQKLEKRYQSGAISFEEFRAQWAKLDA